MQQQDIIRSLIYSIPLLLFEVQEQEKGSVEFTTSEIFSFCKCHPFPSHTKQAPRIVVPQKD